jgi:lipopolysaccharide transport system permease protein
MFATPIIYPSSIVPSRWRWALALNPLAGIIESYRTALFGRPLNWPMIMIATAITLVGLICSAYIFRRMEKSFADVV